MRRGDKLTDTVILGAASPIPGIHLNQVRLDCRCRGNDKIKKEERKRSKERGQ